MASTRLVKIFSKPTVLPTISVKQLNFLLKYYNMVTMVAVYKHLVMQVKISPPSYAGKN